MQQNTKTNQMDRHVGLMRGGERMNLLDIFTQSNFDNAFFVLFFLNHPKNVNFKAKKSNFITDNKQIGENERSKIL
jgi:hypothetical protein